MSEWDELNKIDEENLIEALRYLDRISLSATSKALLDRRGFGGYIQGDLLRKGFITVVAETQRTTLYNVDLVWVRSYLRNVAGSSKSQSSLVLAEV